ncbi:hypothetical protein PRUPE_8G249700 [Prunus persica]|uniref:Pentacotripeptide-repeat region of PRORP domain-containing protein n=1 Tax=Prunus persica TaxID=3760 RepID=A0A251N306_PRUPE|nr:hypothetical protein PRUPE_8G249700 [Prunus persica]
MKRVWKLSDAAQSELLCRHRCSSKTKTLPPYNLTLTNSPNYRFTRDVNAQNHSSSSPSSSSPTSFPSIIGLFIDKPSPQDLRAREDLVHKVTQLRDELVQNSGDSDEFVRVLEEKGSSFFSSYGNGYAVVELMNQLRSWPHLAVEVFYWRRKQVAGGTPMTPEEYAKAITLAGNLVKMEETYELVKHHVNDKEIPLIRAMICAYCKSSAADRVKKIHSLMKLIPENEYRPWLNVLLIRVYAQEDWFEAMEKSIDEAFEHKISVTTTGVMRSIISSYFRCNEVDRLENFVKRAAWARWRTFRSLYHCKMVMYASQKRLEEMESVLNEMENFNLGCTKRTFWILYKAYSRCGQRYKVAKIIGLMWKHGYDVPLDELLS